MIGTFCDDVFCVDGESSNSEVSSSTDVGDKGVVGCVRWYSCARAVMITWRCESHNRFLIDGRRRSFSSGGRNKSW